MHAFFGNLVFETNFYAWIRFWILNAHVACIEIYGNLALPF